jgi:hypothetical protein
MKIYDVTFYLPHPEGGRVKHSLVSTGDSRTQAKANVKSLIQCLGETPTNIEANFIVFGADGKGKSLNKLKNDKN